MLKALQGLGSIAGFSSHENIPLEQKFPEWQTNIFVYQKGTRSFSNRPDGAITIDPKTRRIVAEAKTLNFIKGSGVEIEEYHYDDDGKLIFQCTSVISFGDNFKINENGNTGEENHGLLFYFPGHGTLNNS